MLLKAAAALGAILLLLPREPDLGIVQPPALPQAVETIRQDLWIAADRVRSDLKANGRAYRL